VSCHRCAPHARDLHAERIGHTAARNDGGRLSYVDVIHATSLPPVTGNLTEAARLDRVKKKGEGRDNPSLCMPCLKTCPKHVTPFW
jgi:hypothetical protein